MLLFRHCLVCNSIIGSKEYLCSNCIKLIDKERLDNYLFRCNKCNYPLLNNVYTCENCSRENSIIIYSIMNYSSNMCKRILERYKFFGDKNFAPLIALFIKEGINYIDKDKNSVIVPVPCSNKSLKKRGWDQMLEVCKHLDNKIIGAVLNTSQSTIQQKELKKYERAEYASKKYVINPLLSNKEIELLKTSRVIIVDDVITTGETIYAVVGLLKTIGVNNICSVTWLCEL